MTVDVDNEIRTRPCPDCYMCGAKGELLYQGLRDRLFSAPGSWNLKKCPNRQCGLVWLDPMPLEEEIGKAYRNYYTHEDTDRSYGDWQLKSLLRYGLKGAWNLFLRATRIHWERKRSYLMYLDKSKPGRLLEVGCGNGMRLAQFRARGWEVEGQEVDLRATDIARSRYGLHVDVGKVEDLPIDDATFDAVIMNHVIEHVNDPVRLLVGCHRILKPGGELVIVTPNVESYGHSRFRECWRGLEPPRHLYLYSCNTLQQLTGKIGFRRCESRSISAHAQNIAAGSLDIRRDGRHAMSGHLELSTHIASMLFQLYAMIVRAARKNSGEECVLKAVK